MSTSTMDSCDKSERSDCLEVTSSSMCSNGEMNTNISTSPYVKGLDGTFATYFTDYIVAILCLAYAIKFYIVVRQTRKLIPSQTETNNAELSENSSNETHRLKEFMQTHFEDARSLTQTLCVAHVMCSVMHFVGGVVHHSLRYAIPDSVLCNRTESECNDEYTTVWTYVLPLYLLWQIAKIFASAFAICLLYLAFRTFLCDSKNFPDISQFHSTEAREKDFIADCLRIMKSSKLYLFSSRMRRRSHLIVGGLFVVLLTQVTYHAGYGIAVSSSHYVPEVEDTDDVLSGDGSGFLPSITSSLSPDEEISRLWTVSVVIAMLALSLSCYAVTSTAIFILNIKDFVKRRHSRSPRQSQGALLPTAQEEPLVMMPPHKEEKGILNETVSTPNALVSTVPWSGTLLVRLIRCVALWTIFLGGMIQPGLSAVCGMNDAMDCPLPETFNHNALYHCFLILGSTLWFIAENEHFKLEIQVTERLFNLIEISRLR